MEINELRILRTNALSATDWLSIEIFYTEFFIVKISSYIYLITLKNTHYENANYQRRKNQSSRLY